MEKVVLVVVDVVVTSVLVVVASVVAVVSVVDDVVATVVEVVAIVVLLVLGGHGFGSHVPGPAAMPPAVAHAAGVSSVQVSKAPIAEPCTQHWIGASVVVVVLVTVTVVVLVLPGTVVVLVVATGGHGFGSQVPVPTGMPSSIAHDAESATSWHVSKAPIADDWMQHWVCWPGHAAQQLVPDPTVPPPASHSAADDSILQRFSTQSLFF
jgi:hypothetical protein